MSVLRAILGRFARFLVRIARTLDPGVTATPYWVMPERMAALRLRYPGAPEHWLELLARRTGLGDPAPAPAHGPGPEAGRAGPQPRFGATEPSPHPQPRGTAATRVFPRATPHFPAAIRSVRAIVRPSAASAPSRPAPEAPRAAPRRIRPALTFTMGRARNPIANLLRGRPPNERRAEPRFDHGAAPPDRAANAEPDARSDMRREHLTLFPRPDQHRSAERSVSPPQPQHPDGPRKASPGWPEFHYSAPPGPSWPAEAAKQARHNPRFAASDNRWPELPRFLDEAGASVLRASDEAALLAEQIGGSWSA